MNSETTQLHNLDVHMQSFYRTIYLVHSSTMSFSEQKFDTDRLCDGIITDTVD